MQNNSNVFISQHPLIKSKLSSLRDTSTTPHIFRNLVNEISLLLAYESTANQKLTQIKIKTPLQETEGVKLKQETSIIPIMRAGLGMVNGFLTVIPTAKVWHLGLKRDESTLTPIKYYGEKPNTSDIGTCLILDPMLATGGSASAACSLIKTWGDFPVINYIGLIAAPEGVARLQKEHPDVQIYIAGLDKGLNEKGFIIPGLGDAGDRQFDTV